MDFSYPQFLTDPPCFLFFTGKGGVGKTSIACATAIHLATAGRRVLLVSTDPASNVGQVLEMEIGSSIRPVAAVPGLSALEIDPQAAAEGYRNRIVGPVRGVLPDAVVAGIEEQLSGACTTEIAAFDEFTALLTDAELIKDYAHIVFDTAPTGHTIRLLQLPGAWSGFLEAGKGDASCLGPLAGLEKQRERYKSAVAALADPQRTRLVLVARAQAGSLREVARTQTELAMMGLQRQHLVINGVLPAAEAASDPLAAAIHERESRALAEMPAALRDLPQDQLLLKAVNLVGLDALKTVFTTDSLVQSHGMNKDAQPQPQTQPLASNASCSLTDLIDAIAADGHGLVLLMGKGGVGKTTVAAAIAVALAQRKHPVHLSTSDPAAHLTDTLSEPVEGLTVSRIDPQVETERYRQQVLKTKGAKLDDEGRALLAEDLRSPCTEEIAVFQAFSRIIREAGRKFVIMDTAPTGHTLLLLDATGAYHREVSRQMRGSGMGYTTPMMQLQDPAQTKVLIVTLPETTPVLEAARLQLDLQRAGIKPWAWVINQSLAAADTRSALLSRRAIEEVPQIEHVRSRLAERCAIIPVLTEEPIGSSRLTQLMDTAG